MSKNLIQRKLRERFHVTPRVGTQFSGVLIAEDRTYAVFASVVAYPDNDVPEKVEGEIYIRHDNVAYVQRLTDASRQG
jgi:small nuclear ribonucleoprotein (snRNP)-like protein